MDLLLLGGLTLGLLSIGAIAIAARTAQTDEGGDERCEGCGIERTGVSNAVNEPLTPGPLALVCPVCGSIDPRLAWLDPGLWD